MIYNDTKIVTISQDSQVENHFLNFCVGHCVGGQLRAKLLHNSKDALENSASFDTSAVIGSRWGMMISLEKRPKTYTIQGLKLRRLRLNQITTLNFVYRNDPRQGIIVSDHIIAFHQKIRNFMISLNRTCPKNKEFHLKWLPTRLLILGKLLYVPRGYFSLYYRIKTYLVGYFQCIILLPFSLQDNVLENFQTSSHFRSLCQGLPIIVLYRFQNSQYSKIKKIRNWDSFRRVKMN